MSFQTKLNASNSQELPKDRKFHMNTSWEDFIYGMKGPIDNTIADIFKNCVVQNENQTYSQTENDNLNNSTNIHLYSHPCHKITAKFVELNTKSQEFRRNELESCVRNTEVKSLDKILQCKKTSFLNYLRDVQQSEALILSSYLTNNI